MYRRGDRYSTKSGRTYFFILNPGVPDGKFFKAIETYCNALINSNGGILVFGVDHREQVVGFELTRSREDVFKLNFDAAIRQMRPTIHPHQYRMDVLYLSQYPLALFEIRMSAGEPGEIYENAQREMFIVKEKQLYGPLFPCEITQVVLEKYKEELATLLENNHRSEKITSELAHAQQAITYKETQQEENDLTQKAKKSKLDKITWP